jgi:hypothetical protein
VAESLTIAARFNGPPGSGQGGYTCGLVASLMEGPAEVTLRSPPPLERELAVERSDGAVTVRDGQTAVAEARPASGELELPEPVGVDEARAASEAGYEHWAGSHPFPTCLVCGPERRPPDGFAIFPGELPGGGRFAAPWVPDESLGDPVPPEFVWAALDCPTSAPVANFGDGPPVVLGRLAARLLAPVRAGQPHAIVSWALGVDGRKRSAAAALFTEEGEGVAWSRATWIELRR